MGVLGQYVMTMADWAKRQEPDGGIVTDTVEALAETNEILDDMLVAEGNLITGNRTTIRTGLPATAWRKLNYGIQPSKSRTAQVDDVCGIHEARSSVDVELAKLGGNSPETLLMTEEAPFVEAMSQKMAGGLFYFDTDTEPEKFLGLAPRYPSLSTANVLNAGGSGSDLTSVWLVGWGPRSVFGITPKGAMTGLQREYKGIEPVLDDQTPPGTYYAHVTTYQWKLGLCVKDWRYIVRIANIEQGDTNGITPELMIQAIGKLPSMRTNSGRYAWYMHKSIWTQLAILAQNKSNVALSWQEVFGQKVLTFWGIPLRQVDQLLITEDALT